MAGPAGSRVAALARNAALDGELPDGHTGDVMVWTAGARVDGAQANDAEVAGARVDGNRVDGAEVDGAEADGAEATPRIGRRALLLGAAAAAGVHLVPLAGVPAAAPATAAGDLRSGVDGFRGDGAGIDGAGIDAAAGAGRPAAAVRSVGGYDVLALSDAAGTFFLPAGAAFTGAAGADWVRSRRLDPAAFGPDDAWRLEFRCFAVRRPGGRIMLVDTGIGPAGSPAAAWAPVPGRLPRALAEAGIDPDDVDLVVLTHLHEDHAGWTVTADGRPTFGNARYVVQADEIAALEAGESQLLRYAVQPLRAAGQLHVVSGPVKLAGPGAGRGTPVGGGAAGRGGDRITVLPTPGHTPGHQSVFVTGGRRQVVITGDVLVHAVQLVNPAVGYRYEADPETARRTRHRLLRTAQERRALLATAHLNEPFVPAACG